LNLKISTLQVTHLVTSQISNVFLCNEQVFLEIMLKRQKKREIKIHLGTITFGILAFLN
jgi:hypothetical protein